jgi:osmotically-inducible protein OsmY
MVSVSVTRLALHSEEGGLVKTLMSDEALRDGVEKELKWDPKVDSTHIGTSTKDGAVTLTGRVASYGEKWAAVKAAERVYGVRAVADEIEVQLPSSHIHDDAEIAEEIARTRKWNTLIPAAIEAEVRDGTVTLRGEVEWAYQRNETVRAFRHLAGVRGIVNRITVKPKRKPKASEVERRVEDAIERLADLDARSIWVTTSNGTVKLHGHVHSIAASRLAEHAAEAAPGVAYVKNELVVSP